MAKGRVRVKNKEEKAVVTNDGNMIVELSKDDVATVKGTMQRILEANARYGVICARHERDKVDALNGIRQASEWQVSVINMIREKMKIPEGAGFDPNNMVFIVQEKKG